MTTTSKNNISILKIFNYIGATLIFFGIAFFIGMNWSALNNFTKIFSTLGAAIVAYLLGILLHLTKKYQATSSAFFLIAGLVLPIGLVVTFKIFDWLNQITIANVIMMSICFLMFLIAQLMLSRTVLLLFTIIFGSLLFSSLISFITSHSTVVLTHLVEYEILILGLSYLLLGRYLDFEKKYSLAGPLYFFGLFMVLGSSYSLGGMILSGQGILLWKILTPILIISAFFLSIPLKSKVFLYISALFFVIYLIDMSARFADIFGSYGWPLILVSAGLVLMVVGYVLFYMHKKIFHK